MAEMNSKHMEWRRYTHFPHTGSELQNLGAAGGYENNKKSKWSYSEKEDG